MARNFLGGEGFHFAGAERFWFAPAHFLSFFACRTKRVLQADFLKKPKKSKVKASRGMILLALTLGLYSENAISI